MAQATGIQTIPLRFDSGPAQERLERFQEATPLSIAVSDRDKPDFSARINAWSVANCWLRDYEVSPFMAAGSRNPRNPDRGFVLTLAEAGHSRIWDGSQTHLVGSGDVHLALKAVSLNTKVKGKLVFIPYDAMEIARDQTMAFGRYEAGSVSAQILGAALRTAFDALPGADVAQAAEIERAITGLIRSFFFDRPAEDETRAHFGTARKRAMVELIDRKLSDPEFKAADLMGTFHVSRATLARVFEDEGGVATFITARRLERALHDLTTKPAGRGRIKEAARNVGFVDDAHFRRAFRRKFGFSPSDALTLAPEPS